jgi:single-stranded-DNA-specific exonuclease
MKKWLYKESKNSELVTQLSDELSVPYTISNLLVQRGIEDFETAKTFFTPSWEQVHDPYLMKDMRLAVERIGKALENDEKILVYGDYDVDGTTSVSLVYSFLKKYHDRIDYYIPDRYLEGYGVSMKGVQYAIDNDFKLIIALDCGIKAIDKVAYAKENGVEFIICDHHRPGDKIPDAVAVLDPKQDDCNYPFDELCGCGIGFKLVQAFAAENEIDGAELAEYLDLVAIAIASDIVPINGENRVLCSYGLDRLNKQPRIGIQSFIEAANKSKFNVTDLLFTIGPRINAAGRIHSGKKAVELLISENREDAQIVADEINAYNLERRELDKNITEEALSMIASDPEMLKRKSTVLYSPNWHKGVIGIVASRVMETYYRPTIILTKSGEVLAGSARSVREFDVYNALSECTNELTQFGGHMYAAGMTMDENKLEAFSQQFEKTVANTIKDEQLVQQIEVDAEIDFKELEPDVNGNPLPKLYRLIERFAPFGPTNLRPVFVTNNIVDNGYSSAIGSDKSHLKLNIVQQGNPAFKVAAIAFKMGHLADRIKSGEPFSIAYSIEVNEWRNTISLQLNVKDIKFEN